MKAREILRAPIVSCIITQNKTYTRNYTSIANSEKATSELNNITASPSIFGDLSILKFSSIIDAMKNRHLHTYISTRTRVFLVMVRKQGQPQLGICITNTYIGADRMIHSASFLSAKTTQWRWTTVAAETFFVAEWTKKQKFTKYSADICLQAQNESETILMLQFSAGVVFILLSHNKEL